MVSEALLVTIGGTRCAVPMERVAEVRVYSGAIRIPGAPEWVQGVAEREGMPFEIFDVARRIGFGTVEPHERNCVVFLDGDTHGVGAALLVDTVNGIVPRFAESPASEPYFVSKIERDDESVPLLDLERILEVSA